MAFKSINSPTAPDLRVTGDIEIDAFTNSARIVSGFYPDVSLNGTVIGSRGEINFIEGTGIAITVTDNSGDDRIDVEIESTGGGGGSAHVIRENGSDQTQRDALNFVDSNSIVVAITDDAIDNETQVVFARAALTGDIEATQNSNTTAFRSFAAKSVLANATNSSAVPSDLAGSAAFQYLRVNSSNTGLEWAVLSVSSPITLSSGTIGFDLTVIDSTSIVVSSGTLQRAALTGAIAASQNSNATVFAGILDNGAAENDRTNLNFVSSTSNTLVVTDDAGNDELEITVQRAALTGDITASANSNTTAFRSFAAKSVLANATNSSAVPSDLAGSAAFQYLRVNSANNGLEWATLSVSSPITITSGTIGFDLTAIDSTSIVVNSSTLERAALTGAVVASQNSNATVFAGIRVGGSATTDRTNINFIAGTGITITPTDDAGNDEIEITIASTAGASGHGILDNGSLETQRANLNFLSSTSVTAVCTDDAANNETEVTFQRAALTGDITASANANATAFRNFAAKSVLANATNASASPSDLAGSAAFQHLRVNSANNALEWATLSGYASTSIIYNSNTFERAALTGAIAASQNSNSTLFSGILVNGSATTDRANINFISGTGVTVAAADDAGNNEIEITISATAASVTPTTISIFGTPTNTGVPFIIYVSFSAGTPGTADDVTVFSSTAPFNFRILESWLVTSTAISASTVQARTATAGGGSALSTAMSSTATGKTSDNSTATSTVSSGGSMFLRRSDRGVAGEFFAMCVRT
jgi:hypothetical protein